MRLPFSTEESFDEDPGTTDVQIYVAENSEAGTAVGAPIAATDPGADGRQEILTYTLTGNTGDDLFSIDHGTGQISVGVGTELDFEGEGKLYSVTVTATDPSGDGARAPWCDTVTIMVTVTNDG